MPAGKTRCAATAVSIGSRFGWGGGPDLSQSAVQTIASSSPRLGSVLRAGWATHLRRLFRWYRAPLWLFALLTGAKSFVDNPILGSRRMNAAGLHVWRLRAAHALAGWRRARLAKLIPNELREQFERDGFIAIPDFLPPADFQAAQTSIFGAALECR